MIRTIDSPGLLCSHTTSSRKFTKLVSLSLLLLVRILVDFAGLHFMLFLPTNAQLTLWADRQLIIQIVEALPPEGKPRNSLHCPRPLPILHEQIPKNIYLVLNGMLLRDVMEKLTLSEHYAIPPTIDVLRVKWTAGIERLAYNIDMQSLNHTLLHNPLLNIPSFGIIPAQETEVKITLPCTGRSSGIASFRAQLDIQREYANLRRIPAISIIVYKHCLSADQQTRFIIRCDCRAKCMRQTANRGKKSRKRCVRRCRNSYPGSGRRRRNLRRRRKRRRLQERYFVRNISAQHFRLWPVD